MKRDALIALAIGSVGAVWVLGRRRNDAGAASILGSPVEVSGTPTITAHGQFGVPRAGPPAHTHQGIDLATPVGSNVLAVGDGIIVAANPGLGRIVRKLRLDVPAAWDPSRRRVDTIVYADLGTPLVRTGDRVRKGQPIALVARAGFVHFAVKETIPGGEVFFDPAEAGFAYRESRPLVS
ncbi:MAG TPA: M23 family metallopeptidase [Polyangia bacterium]|jgi:murein DD-endopeptidase MepM/ murein hydrolase activator NlpD